MNRSFISRKNQSSQNSLLPPPDIDIAYLSTVSSCLRTGNDSSDSSVLQDQKRKSSNHLVSTFFQAQGHEELYSLLSQKGYCDIDEITQALEQLPPDFPIKSHTNNFSKLENLVKKYTLWHYLFRLGLAKRTDTLYNLGVRSNTQIIKVGGKILKTLNWSNDEIALFLGGLAQLRYRLKQQDLLKQTQQKAYHMIENKHVYGGPHNYPDSDFSCTSTNSSHSNGSVATPRSQPRVPVISSSLQHLRTHTTSYQSTSESEFSVTPTVIKRRPDRSSNLSRFSSSHALRNMTSKTHKNQSSSSLSDRHEQNIKRKQKPKITKRMFKKLSKKFDKSRDDNCDVNIQEFSNIKLIIENGVLPEPVLQDNESFMKQVHYKSLCDIANQKIALLIENKDNTTIDDLNKEQQILLDKIYSTYGSSSHQCECKHKQNGRRRRSQSLSYSRQFHKKGVNRPKKPKCPLCGGGPCNCAGEI